MQIESQRQVAWLVVAAFVVGFCSRRAPRPPVQPVQPPALVVHRAPPPPKPVTPPILATVPDTETAVLRALAAPVRAELGPPCARGGIHWPPRRVWLLAFKRERKLELWGANRRGKYVRLAVYPILAASGELGPKRRYGDEQVPEGVYDLRWLNPKSTYHLGIHVAYPNPEDIAHATVPRDKLGGDIYVHGSNVSIGCLAMGDRAIESLFYAVGRAAEGERRILIAPCDLRVQPAPAASEEWIRARYGRMGRKLGEFRTP